jgi:MOSC domain-containing protein YiiM
MREVKQRTDGADGAEGALAACLLSLLELDWDGTPGEGPLPRWQEWLAERNLRLVETAQLPPSGFWIAAVERDGAPHHVVMFGAPPDVVHDPAGGLPLSEPRGAFVLVPLDPALPAGRLPETADMSGTVEGLFVAPAAEAPCTAVESAEAVAGRGLRGDRYFDGQGTFGGPGAAGHQITLIEREALDELAARTGIELDSADARRNVVTSGVDLNALAGRRFVIGDVEIVGRRWCEPCAHLQRLTTPGVLRGLVHRGGLRADIVRGGTIARGDLVRPLPAERSS